MRIESNKSEFTVYKSNKQISYDEEIRGYIRCEKCCVVYNAEECLHEYDIDFCPSCGYDPDSQSYKDIHNCIIIDCDTNEQDFNERWDDR